MDFWRMRVRRALSVRLTRMGLAIVLLALACVPVANAFTDYVSYNDYAVYELLDPFEFAYSQGGGMNYRTENNACRSGNSGQMVVAYFDVDWDVAVGSADTWTNCSTGAVLYMFSPNGYYRAGCANSGTVSFHVYCTTWNYSP